MVSTVIAPVRRVLIPFAACLLVLSLLFSGCSAARKEERFVSYLELAEEDLQEARYDLALQKLATAGKFASGRQAWLRLLQLVFIVSEERSDYSLFRKLAQQAVRKLPGNEELHAVYVYAALREGAVPDALESAEEHLRSREYASLTAEAYLKHSAPDESEDIIDESLRPLVLSAYSGRIEHYLEAAAVSGEDGFLLAAVLALAQDGDIAEAFSLFRNTFPPSAGQSRTMYQLGSRLASDALNYDLALQYLDGEEESQGLHEDSLLLRSDILLKQGKKKAALEVYTRLIHLNPTYSWLPFYNGSLLSFALDRKSDGFSYLIRGIRNFPEQPELVLELAARYLRSGSDARAMDVLTAFLERVPGHEGGELLKTKAVYQSRSVKQYEAEIWKLFYDHPDSEGVVSLLAWYLFGLDDRAGLEQLFSAVSRQGNPGGRIRNYRGIYLATQGMLEEAKLELQSGAETVGSWQMWYNLGVVCRELSLHTEAEKAFSSSLASLDASQGTSPTDEQQRSSILSALARAYQQQGDQSGAIRAAREAVLLNRENLEAFFVLREYEPDTMYSGDEF